MANEYQELTSLRVSVSDLHTIRRVLHSYTNELRCSTPPLPTRNELIVTSETICERITAVTMPGANRTPDEFGLSPDEFAIVDSALRAYVVSIGQSIPPSEERDEVMRGCEALRLQMLAGRTFPGSAPS